MKCCDCKYYKEWQGYNEYGNSCEVFGYEYFNTYYEEECPYIDNNHNFTDKGIELVKKLEGVIN